MAGNALQMSPFGCTMVSDLQCSLPQRTGLLVLVLSLLIAVGAVKNCESQCCIAEPKRLLLALSMLGAAGVGH